MTLAKARIVNYDRQSDAPNCSVTYDRHYDDRNSFIIQATGVFVLDKPFQPSLVFVGKSRSLPYSGAPEKCITQVGSGLTRNHWTGLQKLARDKHSSLIW
jgi:hypothetical protein